MRPPVRLRAAALACALALAACGTPSPDRATSPAGADAGSSGTGSDEADASGIADDFPLSAGMGDAVPTSRTGTGLRGLELCGTAPLRGLGTRDRMVADNSGGEALDVRELLLLGSPEEAATVAQAFSDLPNECDHRTTSSGMETTTEVRGSAFGAAPAAVLVEGYVFEGDPGPGHLVVHVVPVGAALLVTQTYGEWPDVSDGITRTAADLASTVAAMDAFADDAGPTTAASASSSTPAPAAIPDDFPLLAGWPPSSQADGAGRTGPTRTGDPIRFTACDEGWREPDHADRLRADWSSAEDYRTRQLTTYEVEAAAAAAVEGLVAQQQSCPTETPGEDGYGTDRDVRPVALGDDAWAILERDTFNGSPSVFGGSTLVVRVGRAVLVVVHGGHAGYPDGDGRGQVEAMGSQASASIAEMCQFTKTGC